MTPSPEPTPDAAARPAPAVSRRAVVLTAAGLAVVAAILAYEVVATAPVRGAVRAYTALVTAGNRGDLEAARALCTSRYLASHRLELAEEGGLAGLPRGIHKNFRAWRQGPDVWLCPGAPDSPARVVFRLVPTPTGWKFDGVAGLLRPGNDFVPAPSEP